MRPAPVSLVCLAWPLSVIAPASAEDFTGFYAGVTAGYAFQREDRERRGFGTATPGGSAADAFRLGLPPSAREASRALRPRDRAAPGSAAPSR